MLEIPVKYEKRDDFRREIPDGAKIVNVVEIKSCKYLLFIVDENGADKQKIIDAGFKTFLQGESDG